MRTFHSQEVLISSVFQYTNHTLILHWFRGHLHIDGEAVSFKSLLIEESLVALSSAFRCPVN